MNTHTENAPNTPDSTVLSDQELGKINAAGLGALGLPALLGWLIGLTAGKSRRPAPTPVSPLHPDDQGDCSAWNNLPNRGGHYDG